MRLFFASACSALLFSPGFFPAFTPSLRAVVVAVPIAAFPATVFAAAAIASPAFDAAAAFASAAIPAIAPEIANFVGAAFWFIPGSGSVLS